MNTKDSYIYRVYTEKSFTKAAKKLFISQPSLSAVIASKEKELGFEIFDRTTKPISLTPEGHIYIEMLEEIIESEKNMLLRVERLMGETQNSISIGGNSSAAHFLLPAICGAFKRRYPKIELELDIGNYSASSSLSEKYTLFQKLNRGGLDAVLSYKYDADHYAGYKICGERVIVAMHKSLLNDRLSRYALSYSEIFENEVPSEKKINCPDLFASVPFIYYSKSGALTLLMSELMTGYVESLHKISNATHGIMHFNMMRAGVGALAISEHLASMCKDGCEDIVYFVFESELATRSIYLVTKKGLEPSSNILKFIEVAKKVCSTSEPLSLFCDVN